MTLTLYPPRGGVVDLRIEMSKTMMGNPKKNKVKLPFKYLLPPPFWDFSKFEEKSQISLKKKLKLNLIANPTFLFSIGFFSIISLQTEWTYC